MMKLPFWIYPGHWKLTGHELVRARVRWQHPHDPECWALETAALEHGRDSKQARMAASQRDAIAGVITPWQHARNLVEIEHAGRDRDIKLLAVDLAHGKISAHEHDYAVAKLQYAGQDLALALLDIDLEHGEITALQHAHGRNAIKYTDDVKRNLANIAAAHDLGEISDREYEKQRATAQGLPWVAVVSIDLTAAGQAGEYELDWNSVFVEQLRAAGYAGATEDLVIYQWFNVLCATIAQEQGAMPPAPSRTPSQQEP